MRAANSPSHNFCWTWPRHGCDQTACASSPHPSRVTRSDHPCAGSRNPAAFHRVGYRPPMHSRRAGRTGNTAPEAADDTSRPVPALAGARAPAGKVSASLLFREPRFRGLSLYWLCRTLHASPRSRRSGRRRRSRVVGVHRYGHEESRLVMKVVTHCTRVCARLYGRVPRWE